jgi:hypothetical protein
MEHHDRRASDSALLNPCRRGEQVQNHQRSDERAQDRDAVGGQPDAAVALPPQADHERGNDDHRVDRGRYAATVPRPLMSFISGIEVHGCQPGAWHVSSSLSSPPMFHCQSASDHDGGLVPSSRNTADSPTGIARAVHVRPSHLAAHRLPALPRARTGTGPRRGQLSARDRAAGDRGPCPGHVWLSRILTLSSSSRRNSAGPRKLMVIRTPLAARLALDQQLRRQLAVPSADVDVRGDSGGHRGVLRRAGRAPGLLDRFLCGARGPI